MNLSYHFADEWNRISVLNANYEPQNYRVSTRRITQHNSETVPTSPMPKNSNKQAAPKRRPQKTSPAARTKAGKKHYDQLIFHDWCKACGICMAFCPVKIIERDRHGKPVISDPDKCIGCRFCELHCPDFAITIEERHPRRRKTDGNT